MLLYDDPRFEDHRPGPGHPERAERYLAAARGMQSIEVERPAVRAATADELMAIHTPEHVARIMACDGAYRRLDADTTTSPGSVLAARLAAGAAIDAAAALLDGERSAYLLSRPPGHHATMSQAMGFCLFNNAALAADCLARNGKRVLVFDPDVHHGNGTQDVFWHRSDVLYCSMHRFPFYPGTGAAHRRGAGDGLGATLNVEMSAGAGDAEYLHAAEKSVVPVVQQFNPDVVVVSAGFDAMAGDPLGGMNLTPAGMAALWKCVHQGLPAMAILEGGYDLGNLTSGVAATARLISGQ